MVRRARWIYPALVCVMIALYYAIPGVRVEMVALVGAASFATIISAVVTRRPARRIAWLLIAFGVLIIVIGETSFNVLATGGRLDDFPSAADWFYVAAYPPLAVGLLWLALPRTGARDLSGMLETAALTLAGSLIVWLTLILPTIESKIVTGFGEAVLIAGWIGDVIVVVAAVRLALVWPRKPSTWLIAGGVLGLFIGDLHYGLDILHGTWHAGGQVDAGILIFTGLVGLAALAPSMATIGSAREGSYRHAFSGLAALAIALMVAPTALLSEMSAGPVVIPIAVVSASVGVLVLMRLSVALSDHRQTIARDLVLRRATHHLGLSLTIADVTGHLRTAFAEIVERPDTSVLLVAARAPVPDVRNELCIPVPAATASEPPRTLIFTAPGRVLLEFEADANALATQATTALQRIELTERIRASEEEQSVLAYRASHDGLTGLANAEMFRSVLREASHTVTPGKMTSVLFIDLDDFKNINDTLGHEAGDAVLASTAQRIRACLRQADIGARLGGDEFAVLLRDIADEATAHVVARRLTDALSQPTVIGGIPVVCRASVGLATATEPDQYDMLLRRADTALYAAKAAGKGRWRPYDPQMQSPLRRGTDLRLDLERALLRAPGVPNGLAMHYQPIVDLRTDRTVGFEALIRWQHPERGPIKVTDLIALAEHTGLILPLGDWVFAAAFQDGVRLTKDGAYVSINVSVAQLRLPGFLGRVRAQLTESTIDPERVVLEITESQLVQDDENIWDDLADLRTSGVRVAIDDYGTGYASLSYLRHPVIDIVKLDQRFLDDISSDRGRALLRAVLGLTHDLGLPMIAEGIEDEPTRAKLLELGCEYGQGHLFARAMPVDEALALSER